MLGNGRRKRWPHIFIVGSEHWTFVRNVRISDNDCKQPKINRARAPKLLGFVAALHAKYSDLTETDDTPWATGPLTGEICDNFINFAVSWSWYNDDLISFVVATAHSHGLHCFDPQSSEFYEAALGR